MCRQSDSVSGIVRAVHQSSSKLGDTPLVRLDLFESLPSRRVCCRASTTNSTAKSRSTVLYICIALSRAGCRALQLYSSLHSTSSTPSLRLWHCGKCTSDVRARFIRWNPTDTGCVANTWENSPCYARCLIAWRRLNGRGQDGLIVVGNTLPYYTPGC